MPIFGNFGPLGAAEDITIFKKFFAFFQPTLQGNFFLLLHFKIPNLFFSRILSQQPTEHGIWSSISKFLRPAQRYDDFKLIRNTCQAACHGKTEHGIWSSISKFLRPAQRYDDFKLIRNTCQAACHGKTEHGIFVKFKKPAKLLSSYLPVSPSRVLRAPGTSPYHLVPKHLPSPHGNFAPVVPQLGI